MPFERRLEAGTMEFRSGEFNSLVKKVRNREAIEDTQLLPFLTLESKAERAQVNLQLAEAFYERYQEQPDPQSMRWARSCIDRAFLLSRYAREVLPLLIRINQTAGDVAAIVEALKRVGLERAAQGDFAGALSLFDRWAYANAEFSKIDTHSFDADILSCIERLSVLYRYQSHEHTRSLSAGKIRLAYLMQGLTEPNSVLVKIDQLFARLHDRSRYELAYFTVNTEAQVAGNEYSRAVIKDIESLGYSVSAAPDAAPVQGQLIALGELIHNFQPHILITSGGLATFKNYFVTCLRPAPLTVALHQGPSPQFSWHTFDHSISWFLTNLPDCPVNCSHVPLELQLPQRQTTTPISRSSLNIPAEAVVMVTGGRWPKFQGENFWRAMIELLHELDDLYWLVIGVQPEQVPFLDSLLPVELRSRIIFHGWRIDYLQLLAASDLVVDTYPVGGAVFLIEAMSLSLPTISFKNDYVAEYSNNDSSGGEEIVALDELLLERGDFEQMKTLVRRLANDHDYRRRLGEKCYEQVRQTRGEPSRMVRRCEEVYEKLLAEWSELNEGVPNTNEVPRGTLLRGPLESGDPEEYKVLLLEQAKALNERETELIRLEALKQRRFLRRLDRGLRRRWQAMRGN